MSFATHRMTASSSDDSVKLKQAISGDTVPSGPETFFSNSGLIDYKLALPGFPFMSKSKIAETPSFEPSSFETTSNNKNIKNASTAKQAGNVSIDDTARTYARQMRKSLNLNTKTPDITTKNSATSTDKRIPSFDEWVSLDSERQLKSLKSKSARQRLKSQYRKEFPSVVNISSTSSNDNQNINERVSNLESSIKHVDVGMRDHTAHLQKFKKNLEVTMNETEQHKQLFAKQATDMKSFKKGLDNHKEAIDHIVLQEKKGAVNIPTNSALIGKFSKNSSVGKTKKRVCMNDMLHKLEEKNEN